MGGSRTLFLGLAVAVGAALLAPGAGPARSSFQAPPDAPPAAPPAAPQVEWIVADRFRLFSETREARARAEALMQLLAPRTETLRIHHDDFVRLLTVDAEPLRKSHYGPHPEGRRGSGRYDRSYLYPASYFIDARLSDPAQAARRCRWRVDTPEPAPEQPCGDAIRLDVGAGRQTETGYRVSARLHLSIDGGPEFAAAEILFHDRLIVALGDSFISGEGNPDVPSRIGREPPPGGREPPPDPVFARADWSGRLAPHQYRRATWWDEPCHRSLLSWPVLASATRAAREPREAVTLVHLGCSGATTGDIIKKGQRDLAGNGEDEPKEETQLAQLQALLAAAPSGKPRRPDHVLLSAGGNDIGFAGVIKALVLPTEYRLGSLAKAAVGALGGVVCPYRNSGPDLNALCALKPSAQKRLEGYLPGALETLSATIAKLEWGPVHHFQYPNPIVGEGNIPCDTQAPPNPPDIHRMGGFEAAMGLVPSLVQGSGYTWGFVLRHRREDDLFQNRELFPGAGCDFEAESRDSEICQGLWVHRRLNDSVEAQHRPGQWNVVAGHLRPILGHGLCRRTQDFPLGQPRVVAGRWSDGWHPRRLEAYSADNQRWFRTTNDSAVIQYGGPKRYYHGTVHPTLMAHIAYADAALEEAFGMAAR
jgi:lysophospholipase L1-like esterase